ncbi:hypothetical protein BEN47_01835 [Hymenobacter lapidarius]|uniref:Lipocalin-like domain-containing protein n=1 Tax=Hymenobacter lapidarius TaxID=1908237 RepID=A0A1G1T614_9BACT|nr:hypothetical protein [Hymenobacter lapidarius]OGX86315.1 hypothetical protein BEN47_01835 [Hymenobacter lapidarius]
MRALFSYTGLLLAALLLATACKKTRSTAVVTMHQLEGTWLNSHEENGGDTLVYRPQTYKFPPSRGRTGFRIEPFSHFEQFDIAPTDGLTDRPGTWTIDRKLYMRITLESGPNPNYTLQVLDLDTVKHILKVRRLPERK